MVPQNGVSTFKIAWQRLLVEQEIQSTLTWQRIDRRRMRNLADPDAGKPGKLVRAVKSVGTAASWRHANCFRSTDIEMAFPGIVVLISRKIIRH